MKLTNLLAITFTTLTYAAKCSIVNYPGVINAIDNFCSRQDITVPSKYATAGKASGFPWPSAHVEITGNCATPQWVPQKYCITQFQNMCANKLTQQKFGSKNCQVWKISYDKKKKCTDAYGLAMGCNTGSDPAATVNF